MTWTSCFNVNVFVSSSYLLIHLLSFLENPRGGTPIYGLYRYVPL